MLGLPLRVMGREKWKPALKKHTKPFGHYFFRITVIALVLGAFVFHLLKVTKFVSSVRNISLIGPILNIPTV
jgi:hypothetical protein